MDSAKGDGSLFEDSLQDAGPSLEDFLAADPSELPFLQESPATTEDFMRYQIFADEWSSIEYLQQLRESVLQLVDSLIEGFIWHQEPFALSVAVPLEGDVDPHLQGEQIFGGNVSDEWLVCYLLFTITSTFSGLTARVDDTDGEFLLIEAATAIPPFLSPANSNYRVWIRDGELHLVMPGCMVDRARTPRTLGSGKLTVSEGLKAVRESDLGTKADEGVQRLLRRRVDGYPDKIKEDMHHVRCFLPRAAALALGDNPGLVAAAVHAFCSGDPADKKLGTLLARLLPPQSRDTQTSVATKVGDASRPAPARFVEARIAFTRDLYARLHQAAAVPTKALPPGWEPSGNARGLAAHAKAAELGQKLSIGLEAAYQRCSESCRRRDSGDVRSAITSSTWTKFMKGLERNGFFEGEIEGSKRYREKTAMAEKFVRDSVLHVDSDTRDEQTAGAQRRCTVHEVVDRAINGARPDYVFEVPTEEDDKEDWLEVSQADLDEMLQDYRTGAGFELSEGDRDDGKSDRGMVGDTEVQSSSPTLGGAGGFKADGETAGRNKNVPDGQADFEDAVDELDNIVTGMNIFVDDSKAGLEGAEVDDFGGEVQFDVDKFMSLLNGEDIMGALEDAAQEDTRDDLHDSDDDLSASSEDEDDLEEKTERMPEPGPSKSAEMEGLATSGALKHSSEARAGHGLQGMSYIQTMAGVRPSVAFQMQEMQGPSDDNELDPNNVEANQTQEQGSIAKGKSDTGGTDGFLKEYMAAMEVELDHSSVGQSFEKIGDSISEAQMEELQTLGPLDQNRHVAREQWLGQDSRQPSPGATGDEANEAADPSDDTPEDFRPVDVDMNLVKHLLESTASQGGLSGPASNLLRSMGLSFPSMPPGSGAAKEPTKVEEL